MGGGGGAPAGHRTAAPLPRHPLRRPLRPLPRGRRLLRVEPGPAHRPSAQRRQRSMEKRQLAVIGLGNMGGGMARRLLETGYALTVYNRTAAKAAPLVEAGARLTDAPERAAAGHQLVLLSLSDENAVEEILFGRVVPVLAEGAVVIDTSTVSPGYAREAAARLAAKGLRRVEACVVGNPLQARKGELRVFTAGEAQDVYEARPVLEAIGSEVVHLGAPSTATSMKLILNLLLGAQVAALAEAVEYGVGAGLDRDQLIGAVSASGFSSMVMRFRADLMLKRTYEPAFFRSALMEKDIRIAVEAAGEQGTAMPVLDLVRERFARVLAAGDGDKDASVLVEHPAEREGAPC
ncbi:NAD(P)-dependent oxidoreductase [Streptomyces sp. NPDC046716]|uniref:NAD(P)-dependent oxidoreductase n=1 Tax=Streptomyces sp. NPDC046716 TaxID=3157093 RepID=UPI003405E5CA